MNENNLILLEDSWQGLYLSSNATQNTVQIGSEDQLCELFERKNIESIHRKTKDSLSEVAGILEGPFFKPDGDSVNGRHYERQLWEKVLDRTSPILANNGVLGTFMHPKTSQDAHPCKASHILKSLWMDDKLGYGKLYLLNTPVGEIVKILSTSTDENGVPLIKLATSSRARGELLQRKTPNGVPIVNPDTYMFETFDIVIDPGIVEAYPTFFKVISESVEYFNDVMPDPKKSTFFMESTVDKQSTDDDDKTFIKALRRAFDSYYDKGERTIPKDPEEDPLINNQCNGGLLMESEVMKSKLSEYETMGSLSDLAKKDALLQAYSELGTVAELTELLSKFEAILQEKDSLNKSVGELETQVDDLKKVTTLVGDNAEESRKIVTSLRMYEKLGTFDELTETLDTMTSFFKKNGSLKLVEEKLADLNTYRKLGSTVDLSSKIEMFEALTKEYGSVKDIKKVIDMTESFIKEYGTFNEAKKVINLTESFIKEYGSFNEAKKVIDMTESFIKSQGTFEEISEALNNFQSMVHKAYITEQSKKYGVPESFVKSLVERHASTNLPMIEESLQVIAEQVKKSLNELAPKAVAPVAAKPAPKPIKLEEDVTAKATVAPGVSQLMNMAKRIGSIAPKSSTSKLPTVR